MFGRAEARLLLFDGAWQQKFGAAATRADRRSVESGTTSESTGTKGRLDYQSTFVFDTSTLADAAHSLTFYAEREHQDFRNRSEGFPSADQYRDPTDYGYVGEYRLGLWDRLFLSAALRFDDNERFEDATTYRATAAYVFPGSGTRLHGSYATGATNPTFFELFGFDPNTFVGNPNLKPETSKGWDAGIEQKLFGDRVVLDVTYFETDLRDEIQTAFLPGFRSTPVNLSGKSTRRGIEVAAQARVTDAFDLSGSFTWLDAEQPNGRTEVRRPKYMASANANYRFFDRRANVNLGVDYNGRAIDNEFVDRTNRVRIGLEDYVLVNLAASYRLTDSVELFGRVENLLDEDYQDVYGFNTPGIGAYAGIRVAFDTP
jgi:vitamin B12 transporter